MFVDAIKDFVAQSPAAASLAGVLLVGTLVYWFIQRPQRLNFPIVELGGDIGYDRALDEGFSKVRLTSNHDYQTQNWTWVLT